MVGVLAHDETGPGALQAPQHRAGAVVAVGDPDVNGVLTLLESGGVIFPIPLFLVATVAAGRGRVGEHREVEVDDGFERFGGGAVAQAFRQCVEPGGILGL